jgi:DNA-binding transcriptional LysR family regulator
MTQPAVSDALARLRSQYGDEILARAGRNMVITPFAKTLIEPLDELLGRIESLTNPSQEDATADIERDFVIATGDSALMALGNNLMNYLNAYLPKVHIQFLDLQHFDIKKLKSGDVDLAIMPLGFVDEGKLKRSFLYREDFVCISRKNHPSFDKGVNIEALKKLPKVGFRADQHSPFRVKGPKEWDEQLLIPQMSMLPYLVETSDAIALTQRHMAEKFARHMAIDIHELNNFDWFVDVYVFWATIHDNCLVHRRLRTMLKEMLDKTVNFTKQHSQSQS